MPDTPTPPPKRSPVELIKETSRQLRGTIAEELPRTSITSTTPTSTSSSSTASTSKTTATPARPAARRAWASTTCSWSAARSPAARSPPSSTSPSTTSPTSTPTAPCASPRARASSSTASSRPDLKATIADINETLLTTLGACGDVNRNVMACPAPFADARLPELQADGRRARRPLRAARRGVPRNLAQRQKVSPSGERPDESNRSTARSTCRASSRSASPCPRTTPSTSSPRISACSPSSRTAASSATTCSSAAAWA